MSLSPEHARFLVEHAIDGRLARKRGVRTAKTVRDLPPGFEGRDDLLPALVFPWRSLDGRVTWQIRPDDPGEGPKYWWPAGVPGELDIDEHVARALAADPTLELVIVEGSKQHLAATSVDASRAVVGMVGCFGWSRDGTPLPDLTRLVGEGRPVVVIMDADVATNLDVWTAAERLGAVIGALGGRVRYAFVPGAETTGLDDVLAAIEPASRAAVLARIIEAAKAKLPRRPARRRARRPVDRFFDEEHGLRVDVVVDEALDAFHVHADDERLVLYVAERGRYERDPQGLAPAIRLLEGRYRSHHGTAVRDVLLDRCRSEGRILPRFVDDPIANFSNGLLDLGELELHEHSPAYLSTVQFPVPWDRAAACPVYEAWLPTVVEESVIDDLEECLGQMFVPTRSPTKAILLYGPSRSGKSTLLRMATEIAGTQNTSAVSLHDLAGEDRFAVADLYGKVLNVCADLSARDLRDLSLFKRATGDDEMQANRKYGARFSFRVRALLAFSANEIPPASESSRAYLERVKPFNFASSFAGAEDRTIEAAMMGELAGIQRRWIEALGRWERRGGYGPTDPATLLDFETRSDRVRQWIEEEAERLTVSTPQARWTAGPVLFDAFSRWTEANAGSKMGRNTFYLRLRAAGIESAATERAKTAFALRLAADRSDRLRASLPHTRAKKEGSETVREGEVRANGQNGQPPPVVVFDLETADADRLWHAGPEFARIAGRLNGELAGEPIVDIDIAAVVRSARSGATLVAHNGFGFDFQVLARHHGLDLLELGDAGRLVDTRHMAVLADPPEAKLDERAISARYELNAVAARLGVEGKTDEIARLAKAHGGFDRIPVDDPEYRSYCAGDVAATAGIYRLLELDDYGRREMRIQSRLAGSITAVGFAVDRPLLAERLADQATRTAQRIEWLAETYGLPLVKADGKPATSPHRTREGLEAIERAFADQGVTLPRTRAGRPALDKVTMTDVLDQCGDDPLLVELAELVRSLNGEPSAYGTIDRHTGADGRVHPVLDSRQASGRFSIRRPGLTILGKRSPALLEQRAVLIADPGEALLCVDLAQIDSRAVAAHAGDEAYAELFAPGRDLHGDVAELLWGTRDKAHRERAKVCSHGWNYGMGVARIADLPGVEIETAISFDQGMRDRFGRLVEWQDEMRALARTGELMDNGFGRWMKPTPSQAYTQGPALMGQGAARDLMMEAVLRLPLRVAGMLRAIVHDELVLAVPIEEVDEIKAAALEAMSFEWEPPHGRGLAVPIVGDASSPGRSWADCYRRAE